MQRAIPDASRAGCIEIRARQLPDAIESFRG
jgi:hypothetical protein